MGLRKKKKVVEEVKEEVVEEIPAEEVPAEEEVITGEIESTEEVVAEEPVVEEEKEEKVVAPVESDIRIGDKVCLLRAEDFNGRPIAVDKANTYLVYAISGEAVQLRGLSGGILFAKLSNIKKI